MPVHLFAFHPKAAAAKAEGVKMGILPKSAPAGPESASSTVDVFGHRIRFDTLILAGATLGATVLLIKMARPGGPPGTVSGATFGQPISLGSGSFGLQNGPYNGPTGGVPAAAPPPGVSGYPGGSGPLPPAGWNTATLPSLSLAPPASTAPAAAQIAPTVAPASALALPMAPPPSDADSKWRSALWGGAPVNNPPPPAPAVAARPQGVPSPPIVYNVPLSVQRMTDPLAGFSATSIRALGMQ